eukprot:g8069.t2
MGRAAEEKPPRPAEARFPPVRSVPASALPSRPGTTALRPGAYPIAGQSLPPTLPVLSLSRPGSALAPPTSSQLPEEPPKPSRRVQDNRQSPLTMALFVKNPMGVSVRLDGVLSPTPENRTRDGTVDWNVSGLVVDRSFSVGGQNAVIERTVNVVRVKDGSVILRAHVSENQDSSSINLLVPSDGAVDPFNSLHVGSLGDVHALLPVCGDDALTHLPEGHAIETSQGSFVDEAFLAAATSIHGQKEEAPRPSEHPPPRRDQRRENQPRAAEIGQTATAKSAFTAFVMVGLARGLELSLPLRDGITLAPALADLGFLVVAPDWPGHGRSQHRSLDASYLATDLPWYAAEVAQELSWTRFGLLGHSMGAAAATLMAASHYPSEEALVALCCVEMLGPIARPARHSPQHLRKGLHSREKFLARQLRGVEKVYGSLEDCIQARLRTVKALPGDQRLTSLSARRLVERAVQTFEDDALGSSWRFRHDTRLNSPSPSYYSEEQVLVLLRHITVPSLLLEADPEGGHAWPRDHLWWEARKAAVKGLRCQQLPGGWFLSALAVVAQRPDLILRLFRGQTETRRDGCYTVQLFLDGRWCEVTVDDQLPCVAEQRRADGSHLAFSRGKEGQLWVPLLEKAYAKAHGSYRAISGGSVAEALLDLTGAATETLILDELPPHELWERLVTYHLAQLPMGCGTAGHPELEEVGLVGYHAYSILELREIDAEDVPVGLRTGEAIVQLLRLRNPHGQGEWNREWSDLSEQWTDSLEKILGRSKVNDGTFWIDFMHFLMAFEVVDVCFAHEAWHSASFENFFCAKSDETRLCRNVYLLHLEKHSQLYISVLQPTKRGTWMRGERKRFYQPGDVSLLLLELVSLEPLILSCDKRSQRPAAAAEAAPFTLRIQSSAPLRCAARAAAWTARAAEGTLCAWRSMAMEAKEISLADGDSQVHILASGLKSPPDVVLVPVRPGTQQLCAILVATSEQAALGRVRAEAGEAAGGAASGKVSASKMFEAWTWDVDATVDTAQDLELQAALLASLEAPEAVSHPVQELIAEKKCSKASKTKKHGVESAKSGKSDDLEVAEAIAHLALGRPGKKVTMNELNQEMLERVWVMAAYD